jgi:hypothetical protein
LEEERMACGSWTLQDGRTWWGLSPKGYVTALLVLLWVVIRFVVFVQAPGGICARTGVCVPVPGAGWWAALLLVSVLLVHEWPLAATLSAFTFALAEGWWRLVTGEYNLSVSRPILDLVYAVACGAHMFYLRWALNRQRGFALAHAAPAATFWQAVQGVIPPRWAPLSRLAPDLVRAP